MKRSFMFGAVVIIFVTLIFVTFRDWPGKIADFLRYGYSLPSSMERRVATINGRSVSFLVFHVPDSLRWSLANEPTSPKSVHEWRTSFGATVVLNGSYFTESGDPAGFYALAGAQSGAPCPIFATSSSAIGYTFGVSIVDDHLRLSYVPTDDLFCAPDTSKTGFVSFPSLLVDGEPAVSTDSGLFARRTMLAEGKFGVDIILTESGEISLYEAARWLDTQPDDYTLAGNLDGGPSTGISANARPWSVEIPSSAVPNVLWAQ